MPFDPVNMGNYADQIAAVGKADIEELRERAKFEASLLQEDSDWIALAPVEMLQMYLRKRYRESWILSHFLNLNNVGPLVILGAIQNDKQILNKLYKLRDYILRTPDIADVPEDDISIGQTAYFEVSDPAKKGFFWITAVGCVDGRCVAQAVGGYGVMDGVLCQGGKLDLASLVNAGGHLNLEFEPQPLQKFFTKEQKPE